MKVIPEMRHTHYIWYLRFYYVFWLFAVSWWQFVYYCSIHSSLYYQPNSSKWSSCLSLFLDLACSVLASRILQYGFYVGLLKVESNFLSFDWHNFL